MSTERREFDARAAWQEVAGYLNFATGASDPKFLRNLDLLFLATESPTARTDERWQGFFQELTAQLQELSRREPAFRDVEQALSVTSLVGGKFLPAYRDHHRDLLYHQPEGEIFRPFFIGRAFEAVLRQGPPWIEGERIVPGALLHLNDFLGHRPVPVLETEQKIEPYPHERVRPVPLYIAGAGVEHGRYYELISKTLEILRLANPAILDAAYFDLAMLDELAFDPRAYDFNHPVNRRPNYHFGQWDPHVIDNKGQYRRFVLVQATLDAIHERVLKAKPANRDEIIFEAAAVLAGTMLMAAGTSGRGPDTHDSTTSLATLLPRIAGYRDAFYHDLIKKVTGPHGDRLREEASILKQPFAGARQHLNLALARHRALQLQHVNLALIFARLGYAGAATRTIQAVPTASARMTCEVQCRLAETRRTLDRGQLPEAAAELRKVVALIHRAVECGALLDPWNIIGFQGQFSLFPAIENSIPDHRVDELLDLMADVFALYSRLWAQGAAADLPDLQEAANNDFFDVVVWFDRYAVPMVSNVRRVFGLESHLAAQFAAGALNAWHKAGAAAGDIAFWRPHAEQFDSWQAYSAVLAALLEKADLTSALAMLVHWAGNADRVKLGEGDLDFHHLVTRWLQKVLHSPTDGPRRLALIRRFFDHLEANAEEFWRVPHLELGDAFDSSDRDLLDDFDPDFPSDEDDYLGEDDEVDEEDEDDQDDEDRELFGAAYEEVVYRDSTDDGTEGDIADDGDQLTDYELDHEGRRLGPRLEFLTTVAKLWRSAAPALTQDLSADNRTATLQLLQAWRDQAQSNRQKLFDLLRHVHAQPLVSTSAATESLLDYDRRRVIKESLLDHVISACVATNDALRWILSSIYALDPESAQAEAGGDAWHSLIPAWSALVHGQIDGFREQWGHLTALLRRMPLLYIPLAKGGDPQKIVAARTLQHAVTDLLQFLPRVGLLRETCQLIAAARLMEQDHPVGVGAVSEFDRLFDTGFKAIVGSLVEAAQAIPPPHSYDVDETLIDHLQQLTESLVSQWLAHSRTLRLSVLERLASERDWNAVRKFIETYGHDIFTQFFLNLGNLRAILHQGVDKWVAELSDHPDTSEWKLTRELDDKISQADAVQHLGLVIEAIVENYEEYRDYNTTTTNSDRGELIYTLLDLLRLKSGYERINWNLKPLVMAHEILVRRGRDEAAELWRRAIIERTSETADQHQKRLRTLQDKHSLKLVSLADRIGERFVRPLLIDRLKALIRPAIVEAREGQTPTAFPILEQEAGELAAEPGGPGLDAPDWIVALEEETAAALSAVQHGGPWDEAGAFQTWRVLTWEEIRQQLANWETLSLPGDHE